MHSFIPEICSEYQQHRRHSSKHGDTEAKKTDKDPCWPRGDGNTQPDSKQVNALINKIITEGDELGRVKTGRCAGERQGGRLPTLRSVV